MLRRSLLIGAGSALSLPVTANAAGPIFFLKHPVNIVAFWDSLATTRIRYNPQLGPIGDALMGAGLHTSIYNAWTAYTDNAKPAFSEASNDKFRFLGEDRTDKNKHETISYAAYTFLVDRFSDDKSIEIFKAAMKSFGYDPDKVQKDAPSGAGVKAALQVIEWRSTDGSNYNGKLNGKGAYSDHTGYVPINAPLEFCNPQNSEHNANFAMPENVFAWSPLKNPAGVVQKFAGAQMGTVTPFTISASQIPTFDRLLQKPDYLKDIKLYKEECEKSISYSAGLNPTQKLLVEFWADGPGSTYFPTAHWRYFTKYVAEQHNYGIDDNVKLFYAVAITAADAGIMTWLQKRNVNGSRPITGIRTLYRDAKIRAWGGPGHPTELIYGDTWSPFNPSDPNLTVAHQSPGFPGWPSGHTMFSSSCASVLQKYTGSDTFNFSITMPENYGIVEQGVPQKPTEVKFKTFSEAARSATMSRIWSGIHFTPDCNDYVMSVGAKVGEIAWNKAKSDFNT